MFIVLYIKKKASVLLVFVFKRDPLLKKEKRFTPFTVF